jgi:hypothetical protein
MLDERSVIGRRALRRTVPVPTMARAPQSARPGELAADQVIAGPFLRACEPDRRAVVHAAPQQEASEGRETV